MAVRYTECVQRYLLMHVPIILLYVIVVMVRRFEVSLDLLWLGLGVTVGVYLLYLDRVVYTFSFPQEQLSQQFAWVWKGKQYFKAIALLDARREEQQKLTFRSALFMLLWIPLALFALTSTVNDFGRGVVMGLMLHVLYDSWRLQRSNPEVLKIRLFWQIKRVVSGEEQILFLVAQTIVFVLFTFWV